MANEIKLNCHFRSTDELEVIESNHKVCFITYAFDEEIQEKCEINVYAMPDDAIRFAERIIRLAREIKGCV